MLEDNSQLPQNLRDLLKGLSLTQAVPLGEMNDLPLLFIKITEENADFMSDNEVVCTINPSIFNIEYQDETLALCFVQIKLNNSDKHIYTVRFDLKNEKQFKDAMALLNMDRYGVLMASDTRHNILQFKYALDDSFDPRHVLTYARSKATDYNQDILEEVTYGLTMQADSIAGLWEHFETIAPYDKQWYAGMKMER